MKKLFISLLFFITLVNMFLIFNNKLSLDYLFIARESILIHNYYLAVISFTTITILLLSCCIPCSSLLRIAAGYLFGVAGFIYSLLASCISAYLLYKFGNNIKYKKNKKIKNMIEKINRRPYIYLFSLRIIPIFPSWLLSSISGNLKLDIRKFMLISFVGFLPGIAITTYIGIYAKHYEYFIKSVRPGSILNSLFLVILIVIIASNTKK